MIGIPEPINEAHEVISFISGEASLDDWLRTHALANQERGASRTYVIAEGARVIGYYALAAGAIISSETAGRVRRNMPDPIPVMILGRLAIDKGWQGKGLGFDLLQNAVVRTLQAAEIVGVRALLVHALHEKIGQFYEKAGFSRSPTNPLVYMLLLKDARGEIGGTDRSRRE